MKPALPRLGEMGDRENEAELLLMLSRACRMPGDLDEALSYGETDLRIGSNIGKWRFETEAVRERSRIFTALADAR